MNLSKTLRSALLRVGPLLLVPLTLAGCLEPDAASSPRRVYGSRYPAVRQNSNPVTPLRPAAPTQTPPSAPVQQGTVQLPAYAAETIAGSTENQAALRAANDAGSRGEWATADALFSKACLVKCEPVAQGKAEFARTMREAENLVNVERYDEATVALQRAVGLGTDWGPVAKERLKAVQRQPYDIRVSELIINPANPKGDPWVKPKDNTIASLFIGFAANYLTGGAVSVLAAQQMAQSYADRLPPELTPRVFVQFELPNGEIIKTKSIKSLASAPVEHITLSANLYSREALIVRVFVEKTSVFSEPVNVGELLENDTFTFSAAGTGDEITDKTRTVIFLKVQANLSGSTQPSASPALPRLQLPPGQTF
jgi:hypothetical protein